MLILDPYGMTFDAVCVFGLDFHLLFKSGSSHCACILIFSTLNKEKINTKSQFQLGKKTLCTFFTFSF